MYLEKSSDIYEYLHEDVQFFLKSAARFKILLSLLESPRSLEEIRNSSGVSMPAVYSNIRLLLEEGLVKGLAVFTAYHMKQPFKYFPP